MSEGGKQTRKKAENASTKSSSNVISRNKFFDNLLKKQDPSITDISANEWPEDILFQTTSQESSKFTPTQVNQF
jgi:hypothetical protein